ncbi:histidinol-phosphate transaminase [Eudoraea chungangensis]|uniref:histidinol-phosphate transaminase n=1 Tax=Eudoraea chungangensis TaxID=1481905 RepID=UPI0023EC7F8F|nr:histidinol-phosphate transaminase [Eudoraea chungangensis]
MGFSLNKLVRESIKDLVPYSSARDEFTSNGEFMIFLDANESPYPNGVNRYPDPQQRTLKGELSKKYSVPETSILLGNGSDEVLDLIYRAFCEPQMDNIITMPPTYGMYKVLAGINAIENREVYLTDEFQLDVEGIMKQVNDNTKLILLCSPNNPTANSFSYDSIICLLEGFKGLVVVDEAYIDFAKQESLINRLEKYPNLIVTRTFSKAIGLAGLRLGVCIASEEVIQILNRIKPPYNINELTQARALQEILNEEITLARIAEINIEKDRMVKELKEIGFIEHIYPSEANFILVKVDDANLRYKQLIGKGIVIRNRSSQPLCENCLRFSIGLFNENNTLIRALQEL